jgi:hypothetical protein
MAAGLFRNRYEEDARFRTIELRATVSNDGFALARASARAADALGREPGSIRSYSVGATGPGREQFVWRVWWAPPSSWRDEITWRDDLTDVALVRDDVSLIYVAGQRTMYTNEVPQGSEAWQLGHPPPGIVELPTVENRLAVFPLFRPPLPESEWLFETSREETYLGRRLRRVRAVRRPNAHQSRALHGLGYWLGINEYECLVDDELRMLMSFRGIADGRDAAVIVVDAVSTNASLPKNIFSFEPPPGSRIVRVDRAY